MMGGYSNARFDLGPAATPVLSLAAVLDPGDYSPAADSTVFDTDGSLVLWVYGVVNYASAPGATEKVGVVGTPAAVDGVAGHDMVAPAGADLNAGRLLAEPATGGATVQYFGSWVEIPGPQFRLALQNNTSAVISSAQVWVKKVNAVVRDGAPLA